MFDNSLFCSRTVEEMKNKGERQFQEMVETGREQGEAELTRRVQEGRDLAEQNFTTTVQVSSHAPKCVHRLFTQTLQSRERDNCLATTTTRQRNGALEIRKNMKM